MHRRKEINSRLSKPSAKPSPSAGAWWLKSSPRDTEKTKSPRISTSPYTLSDSMSEFLKKEQLCEAESKDLDINNILEEINRLAAESPGLKADIEDIGGGQRTMEDIMREAEKLSQTSSRNIDELTSSRSNSSLRSRSTPAVTPRSSKSTPKSPRSYSQDAKSASYKSDFEDDLTNKSSKSKLRSSSSDNLKTNTVEKTQTDLNDNPTVFTDVIKEINDNIVVDQVKDLPELTVIDNLRAELKQKNIFLEEYEKENRRLLQEVKFSKVQLNEVQSKLNVDTKSPTKHQEKSLQTELNKALENFKDLQEQNTALQLQLETLNNSHHEIKDHNDRLLSKNSTIERKLIESESTISRLRNDLQTLKEKYLILVDSEKALKIAVDHEKQINKNLKSQSEKDANIIQDLNRQVKEMDRIIKRKKPDSVSALILAANASPESESRKLLEDRIKQLEEEAKANDQHSTKIFVDIQDKFNKMKEKYENHIEDLEKHVLDLKYQLTQASEELVDVSTQTFLDTNKNVDFVHVAVQTITNKIPKRIIPRPINRKDETQFLNTIRNLTQEVSEKDAMIRKLEREMDELFKTNRRLQKEREGTLKSNIQTKKVYNPNEYCLDFDVPLDLENMNTQIDNAKDEKEKLKIQLHRLEEDYQMLKLKRLQDLNTLQEAHEQELTNYMGKMAPLREQLDVQQITIKKLQQHLATAREQVAVLTVERDHLETRLKSMRDLEQNINNTADDNQVSTSNDFNVLQRRIAQLERRYEERESRLRAIVQGLAQKQTTNSARDCEQCMIRQQQLCGYKAELDQVLSTLRNCTNL